MLLTMLAKPSQMSDKFCTVTESRLPVSFYLWERLSSADTCFSHRNTVWAMKPKYDS
jgi:hypothetical protein